MSCPIRFMSQPEYNDYGFSLGVNFIGTLTVLAVASTAFGWIASYASKHANFGIWTSKILVYLPASIAIVSIIICLTIVGGVIFLKLKG